MKYHFTDGSCGLPKTDVSGIPDGCHCKTGYCIMHIIIQCTLPSSACFRGFLDTSMRMTRVKNVVSSRVSAEFMFQ